jgi:hypothetical protein
MIKKPFELLEKLNFIKEENLYYKEYQDLGIIKVYKNGEVDFDNIVIVEGKYELLINKFEVHTLIAFIDLYYQTYHKDKPKLIINRKYEIDNNTYGYDLVVGNIGVLFENEYDDCKRNGDSIYLESEHPLILEQYYNKEIESLLFWTLIVDEDDNVGFCESMASISGIIEKYKWKRRCPKYAGTLHEQITRRKELIEKLRVIKTFKFTLGNSFNGYKKFLITFNEETVEFEDNCSLKKEIEEITPLKIKNEILNLFLFNWKDEYISTEIKQYPISWELSLNFNGYESIIYRGVEEFPLNYCDLEDFINKYSYILQDKEK